MEDVDRLSEDVARKQYLDAQVAQKRKELEEIQQVKEDELKTTRLGEEDRKVSESERQKAEIERQDAEKLRSNEERRRQTDMEGLKEKLENEIKQNQIER